MRYAKEKDCILMDIREFVSIARGRFAPTPICDEDEPRRIASADAVAKKLIPGVEKFTPHYTFETPVARFEINFDDAYERAGEIYVFAELEGEAKAPDRELEKQCRAEAYISGYIYAKERSLNAVKLIMVYNNSIFGYFGCKEEFTSIKKLESFFNKCVCATVIYARPEIDRVTKRLPTLADMRFPYPDIREGQSSFIHSAYRAISRGGRLIGAAPTGTGKTVSALYPALRAYGGGRCDKIFYFTPKSTTAEAARDCLMRMSEVGAIIRGVILSSKENSCESGLICKRRKNLCKNQKFNKLADAALALYEMGKTVVTLTDARTVAREFSVCPYELLLTYSELCDVVICDFNYLFDPQVYIRRYFTSGGGYAFLFDEAHNLPDRAQSIYSAEITDTELEAPLCCELIGELSPLRAAVSEAVLKFRKTLNAYLRDEMRHDSHGDTVAATHMSEVPGEIYGIFSSLAECTEIELLRSYSANDDRGEDRIRFLRSYLYTVKKLYSALMRYDSSYETFMFLSGGTLRLKLFCVDPSGEISKRLDLGSSAVFFSATLSPLYYYSAMLGLGRDAELLEVDSPFTRGQLSVSIMDKVGTRLSEREDTLSAVCKIIAATVSAKRGNYMIFSPSFAYSEALAAAFASKYPKIQVISQKRDMTRAEKSAFIEKFKDKNDKSYLIGFCVMGGIYSEGIDLAGDSLIGAVIVGIGIPALSFEREAMRQYYDERFEEGMQFAYVYPGINRVLQAGGRVIRREDDYGVLVLIDDRFDDPIYKKTMPKLWSGMKFIPDAKLLREELDKFWAESGKSFDTAQT